ncbi:putative nucleotidyltransferase [Friedmanniella endophytica]|uniref:Putative nucleotidyltransferase n=1 Tax=Microlunatus kandeliicorticis TaxID=1759536 RepID=A0A7W3IRW5_9ACTN|nr:putative nucleotidyltransferase [Microlunatus kandeliicorticis]
MFETLERARRWVRVDVRIRAALIHGSVVQGDTTPLSDLDLIVIAEPGERDAIWADRLSITDRLLGAPAAVTEVLPQRPYRWQARTLDLAMLDFTIDETYMAMWDGFEGPVEFLIDRADVQARFEQDMAAQATPSAFDARVDCDDTWGRLAKLTALTLHGRRHIARTGLHDLIGNNLLTLLDRDPYRIGSIGDAHDVQLVQQLDFIYPASSEPAELQRALMATAHWYGELLTAWAARTGKDRPTCPIEGPVTEAIQTLARSQE